MAPQCSLASHRCLAQATEMMGSGSAVRSAGEPAVDPTAHTRCPSVTATEM
jgi:hypothetical protein